MGIKKILISQPKPASDKSPYFDVARERNVELVFKPFIKVEGVSSKEFRKQKVNISNFTAVVFTSRHAIDNYFSLAKEMRIEIPESMKYFCVTETISLYIQKYTQYRKRKVFFGTTGKIDDLIPTMVKHKDEKYLIPMSDTDNSSMKALFDEKKLNYTDCIMYRTVNNDFSDEEKKDFDYDMVVLFTPSGVKSLLENFPQAKEKGIKVGTFGPATSKAAQEAGLNQVIEAPSKEFPSMTSALMKYLEKN